MAFSKYSYAYFRHHKLPPKFLVTSPRSFGLISEHLAFRAPPILDTRTAPLPPWRDITCKCIPLVDGYFFIWWWTLKFEPPPTESDNCIVQTGDLGTVAYAIDWGILGFLVRPMQPFTPSKASFMLHPLLSHHTWASRRWHLKCFLSSSHGPSSFVPWVLIRPGSATDNQPDNYRLIIRYLPICIALLMADASATDAAYIPPLHRLFIHSISVRWNWNERVVISLFLHAASLIVVISPPEDYSLPP